MKYISVKDAANLFDVTPRRVQQMCMEGRIPGAIRISNVWLVPEGVKRPKDLRKKEDAKDQTLTLEQLCEYLKISVATGRNWLRLGRMEASFWKGKHAYFTKEDSEKIKEALMSGENDLLKSRRNKRYKKGTSLYKDYIKTDSLNFDAVKYVIDHCYKEQMELTDKEIRWILADCSLKLMSQVYKASGDFDTQGVTAYLDGNLSFGEYDKLFDQLLSKTRGIKTFIKDNRSIFDRQYYFVKKEDLLGFLYMSCKNIRGRKAKGIYYTPEKIVSKVVDQTFDGRRLDAVKILDPCCGTGNFFIELGDRAKAENLYGYDIDETSIILAKINMALNFKDCSYDMLQSNFKTTDFLRYRKDKFDYILGNPPWGYDFSKEEEKILRSNFKTCKGKNIESYDVFVEHSLDRLKDGGSLCFILPEAFLTVKSHEAVRRVCCEEARPMYLEYLGDAFSGVNCPSIVFKMRKDACNFNTSGMEIRCKDDVYKIEDNRDMKPDGFTFNLSDKEFRVFEKIERGESYFYLKDNCDFALGLITGNNDRFLYKEMAEGLEPVFKGTDVFMYRVSEPKNFIDYRREEFQQVAKEEIYRAPEKIIYRFISDRLVFTLDDKRELTLNSCNIIIPRLPGVEIKYVLAVLNSSVMQFFYEKKFESVKVLRSHIEMMPIPRPTEQTQMAVLRLVDLLLKETDDELREKLYDEIDVEISRLFGLSREEHILVCKSIKNHKKFL